MPKVKEGYFEAKRDAILDAAEKVCREKPLYKMTMKDVTTASGLSPGAIYDSFSGIDELIVALINRLGINAPYRSVVKEILQEKATPESKIEALVSYFVELVHLTVQSYGRILFELSSIYIDAQRRSIIEQGMSDLQIFNHVLVALMSVIEENIENGYFKPLFPTESIYAVVFSFFDGLVRDLTLVKCYKLGAPGAVTFEEGDIPKAMASSIIHMLNQKVYSGRDEFIGAAIQSQLETDSDKLEISPVSASDNTKWTKTIGVLSITKKTLETLAQDGEKLNISVIGMLIVDSDVSTQLFEQTIDTILVRGKTAASDEIKALIEKMN